MVDEYHQSFEKRDTGMPTRLAEGVKTREVNMSVTVLTVVVDCADPRRQADFWAGALAYDVQERNADEFQVSDPTGVGAPLYFMKVPETQGGQEPVASGPCDRRLNVGRCGPPGAPGRSVR